VSCDATTSGANSYHSVSTIILGFVIETQNIICEVRINLSDVIEMNLIPQRIKKIGCGSDRVGCGSDRVGCGSG
jgi:hypothetical protein